MHNYRNWVIMLAISQLSSMPAMPCTPGVNCSPYDRTGCPVRLVFTGSTCLDALTHCQSDGRRTICYCRVGHGFDPSLFY